jgi:hypothetical protein
MAIKKSEPLPKIVDDVATLAAKVDEHLKKMGFNFEKKVKASSAGQRLQTSISTY